jgi:hypothetical protein
MTDDELGSSFEGVGEEVWQEKQGQQSPGP